MSESQTARAATLDEEQHRWMWLKLEQLLEKQHTTQKQKQTQAGAAPQNWPTREDQLREQLAEALKTQVGYFIMTVKS
jgi:hypothetical protein